MESDSDDLDALVASVVGPRAVRAAACLASAKTEKKKPVVVDLTEACIPSFKNNGLVTCLFRMLSRCVVSMQRDNEHTVWCPLSANRA